MENKLEFVKQFLRSFISKQKGGSVLGIDIGSSSIKVVQLRKKKGVAVLETYGELSLGPYSNLEVGRATNLESAKLAEALNDVLREANTTTNSCGISIPFGSSLISIMRMPAVGKRKLSKMIPIEARKYIPVPISEITLDWFVIPESDRKFLSGDTTDVKNGGDINNIEKSKDIKKGKTDILLVAILNKILNKYRDVLKQTDLSVSFYEIEVFSTIRSALGQGIEPTMVVDIGAASTKVYIVEFGIVKTSHIINKGGQDITLAISRSLSISVDKAERLKRDIGLVGSSEESIKESILLTLEYIFSEANKVLLSYQRKYNRNIGAVVFAGGGSVLKGFLEASKGHFNTEVKISDPFSKTESPAFLGDILKEVGPGFSVSIGIALRKLQEFE